MVTWEDMTAADKKEYLAQMRDEKKLIKINLGNGVSHIGRVSSVSYEVRVTLELLNKHNIVCWLTDIRSVEVQNEHT